MTVAARSSRLERLALCVATAAFLAFATLPSRGGLGGVEDTPADAAAESFPCAGHGCACGVQRTCLDACCCFPDGTPRDGSGGHDGSMWKPFCGGLPGVAAPGAWRYARPVPESTVALPPPLRVAAVEVTERVSGEARRAPSVPPPRVVRVLA